MNSFALGKLAEIYIQWSMVLTRVARFDVLLSDAVKRPAPAEQ
jgi:hypothetical protein